MKNFSILFMLPLMLGLVGAGCWSRISNSTSTTSTNSNQPAKPQEQRPPQQTLPPPATTSQSGATSTPQAQGNTSAARPTPVSVLSWTTFQDRQAKISFNYPSNTTLKPQKAVATDLAEIDLGPTVTAQGVPPQNVPNVVLRVFRVQKNSTDIKNCYYSDNGWQGGQSASTTRKTKIGNNSFCLSERVEGAAGTQYHSYYYSVPHTDGYAIFTFIVRAPNCGNFPNPAADCVNFDEKRDTAMFENILKSYKTL